MYTSVMLVALLGPGATPVVTQAPLQQVVYHSVPGQVVYFVSSQAPTGAISPVVSSPTIVYSQPTAYVMPSSPIVTATTASPVIYSASPVIQYSGPVLGGPGLMPAAPMGFSPMMMGAGGAVCRS